MGLPPAITAAPNLLLKIAYPDDSGISERLIGYVNNVYYMTNQGQRMIFTVDSPFPAEIAQSASPSMVRGGMTLYMPKGWTPERAGLVPYRVNKTGGNAIAATKYINIRLYDRSTGSMVVSLDFCKVNNYRVVVQARQVVRVDLQFEGFMATPGNVL